MEKNVNLKNYSDKSELEKDQFFELLPDLYSIIDYTGNFIWKNSSWEKSLKFNESQLNATGFYGLIQKNQVENLRSEILKKKNEDKTIFNEAKILCGDDEYKWIYWESYNFSEKKIIYITGKDISNEKQNSEELSFLKSLFTSLQEKNSPESALNQLLKRICEYNSWPYAEAWVPDDNKNLKLAATYCNGDENNLNLLKLFAEENKKLKIEIGKGTIGNVWVSKKLKWINDLPANGEYLRKAKLKNLELNSMFVYPILSNDEPVSLLAFYLHGDQPRSINKINLITAIVTQYSIIFEKKKIEQKLIKSEHILTETQKISHIGSWEWDLKSNKIFWSDELYNIYAISKRDNLDYDSYVKLLPPEDKKLLKMKIETAIKDKKPYTIEHRIVTHKGESKTIIGKGEVIVDKGEVVKLIGTAQDITDQKRAAEGLIKSEEYFRSLIENSLDVKTILDENGNIKFISPSVERIFGYKVNEMIGRNPLEFIARDDYKKIKDQFNFIMKSPELITSFEFKFRNKRNEYCNIESIMKNMLTNTAVCGIVINSRDITSKKSAENLIKNLMNIGKKLNSTLNLEELLDYIVSEGIKLLGTDSGIIGLKTVEGFITKKFYTQDEVYDFEYNWSIKEGIPGEIVGTKTAYISNEPEKDSLSQIDILERFKIKAIICAPILDAGNDVLGFIQLFKSKGTFNNTDVEKISALTQSITSAIQNALAYQKMISTELQLKYSREQLRRLSAHLQSAREEERTRISREIHDELGQALTGLKMDLSWMEKKVENGSFTTENLKDKLTSMSVLIDSTIKTVRKISSELRPGVLDYLGLSAAIEWQAQDFQNRTGIVCEFVEKLDDLNIDQQKATAIFRIFQETLTNIARHSNASLVEIKLSQYEENLYLSVIDNGRGITNNEIINSKSFGLLGMRERANLLGGDFQITGSEKGTVVTVAIPISNLKRNGDELW